MGFVSEQTQYKKFRKKLLSFFDSSLVSIETAYKQAIFFNFASSFSLVIIPYENEYKATTSSQNTRVLFDKDFSILNKLISNQKIDVDFEDPSYFIHYTLRAFKKGIKKKDLQNIYDRIYDYKLKRLIYQKYKMKTNPDHEYFLFSDDQLRPRFWKDLKEVKLKKEGERVLIKDERAFLLNKNGELSLTLDYGGIHKDEKFFYLGNITYLKKCKKEEADSVRYNPKTKKKTYMKTTLKKEIDLSKEEKIPYTKANNKIFTLKKTRGEYYLLDKNEKKVQITHPDLLVYFLDRKN